MKKLILLFALIATINATAQKTLVIDSLNNDTTYAGQTVKVYMSVTGAWDAAYALTLRLNNFIAVSGTYKSLVDSNFVWSFIVPSNTPIGLLPITIYNATTHIRVIFPENGVGINELFKNNEVTSVIYYDLSGREINNPESGIFIEFDGIRSRKVVRIK